MAWARRYLLAYNFITSTDISRWINFKLAHVVGGRYFPIEMRGEQGKNICGNIEYSTLSDIWTNIWANNWNKLHWMSVTELFSPPYPNSCTQPNSRVLCALGSVIPITRTSVKNIKQKRNVHCCTSTSIAVTNKKYQNNEKIEKKSISFTHPLILWPT